MVSQLVKSGKTFEQIRCCFQNLEESFVSDAIVENLSKFVQDKYIQQFCQMDPIETPKLGFADSFVKELAKLPDIVDRLGALAFVNSAQDGLQGVRDNIAAIADAAEGLMESDAFHDVLNAILDVSNFLNLKSKGTAYGIKINTILRLQDAKTADGTMSMLQVLAKTFVEGQLRAAGFVEEIGRVKEAAKTSLDDVQERMRTFGESLKKHEAFAKNPVKNVVSTKPPVKKSNKIAEMAAKFDKKKTQESDNEKEPGSADTLVDKAEDVSKSEAPELPANESATELASVERKMEGESKDLGTTGSATTTAPAAIPTTTVNDSFWRIISDKLADIRDDFNEVAANVRRTVAKHEECMRFYGETPGDMKAEEFYGIFTKFVEGYQRAIDRNRVMKEEAAAAERRRQVGF